MEKTLHQQILEAMDLRPGDTVRIVRTAESGEFDWANYWEPALMDKFLGREFNVGTREGDVDHKYGVYGLGFWWPAHSLKKIKPEFKTLKLNEEYTAKVYPDRVEVGCQTFTRDVVKALYELTNSF